MRTTAATQAGSASSPFRVLLVEDDSAHALVISRAFQSLDVPVSVDHVEDGEDAIHRLERAALPDLVLLDLKLTGIQGLEVLSRIKSSPSLTALPVIVLTTSDSEHDRVEAFRRHANAYVQKPDELDGFRSLARTLVGFWGGHHVASRRGGGPRDN